MATDTSQPEVDAQGVPVPVVGIQLTQVRVPLDEAAEALSTQDEAGRLPIVVLPKQAYRIRNGFVGAGLLLVLGGLVFDVTLPLRGGTLAAGALLIILGVFRAFMVPVPEDREPSCFAAAGSTRPSARATTSSSRTSSSATSSRRGKRLSMPPRLRSPHATTCGRASTSS